MGAGIQFGRASAPSQLRILLKFLSASLIGLITQVVRKTDQSPSGRAISQLQSIRLSLELSGVRLE